MRYISTRGKSTEKSFEDVLLAGLADDGGLYVPKKLPRLTGDQITALKGLPYEAVVARIIAPFLGDCFSEKTLDAMIERAYQGFSAPERVTLKDIGDGLHLLELFHGPTFAFKDFAMQLIGQMFQTVLSRRNTRLCIVGATSGDTGAAAMEAFRGLDCVKLFILFPRGGVSEAQRRQMTTPSEENLHAIAVDGDFDACQAHVKAIFADHAFRNKLHISGVNSINWARILAQVVYYFVGAVGLGAPAREIDVTVPTGNFGDIFAGYIARQMGLSLGHLGIATNQNDILHRCLNTGDYLPQKVRPSISPAMDIQHASNFERLIFDMLDRNSSALSRLMQALNEKGSYTLPPNTLQKLRTLFFSGAASETDTLNQIKKLFSDTGEIVCTHTAVGLHVARQNIRANVPMLTLATAHPAKFPDAIKTALGRAPDTPKFLEDIAHLPERVTHLPNDTDAIKNHIERSASK